MAPVVASRTRSSAAGSPLTMRILYFGVFYFSICIWWSYLHMPSPNFGDGCTGDDYGVHSVLKLSRARQDDPDSRRRDDDSMSACLLTMDDNHFLVEWLAFHYHVCKLRHLVVAIDPKSTTSPLPIFDRWKGLIEIEVWESSRYMSQFEEDLQDRMDWHPSENSMPQLAMRRTNQAAFNVACMKHLKGLDKGWTFLTDTDEFLHLNQAINDGKSDLYLRQWGKLFPSNPIIKQPGSVSDMLKELRFPNEKYKLDHACVPLARRQFSSREGETPTSPDTDRQQMLADLKLRGDAFQTIRWKRWGYVHRYHPHLAGKAVVDLARLRLADFEIEGNDGDPHLPLGAICDAEGRWVRENQALLVANHYMGTLEQWGSRKNDARGHSCLQDLFFYQNEIVGKNEVDSSSDLSPWLSGFVGSVGVEEATRLRVATLGGAATSIMTLRDLRGVMTHNG